MFNNLSAFLKIWASQGPKVEIPDANVAQGWGYLGQRPPEVEEFNYVQNLADEKILFLFEAILHWQPNRQYSIGDIATSKKLGFSYYLECTQAGISSGTEPDWTSVSIGETIDDNTARWVLKSLLSEISAAAAAALAGANAYTDQELEEHKTDNIAYLNALAQEISQNKRHIENTMMEIGQVNLVNTLEYPFNNSKVTVNLKKPRNTLDYTVTVEYSGVNIGDVIISDKQTNGFKIEYTGSAASASIKYYVKGGMI